MYYSTMVSLTAAQKAALVKALRNQSSVSIRLSKSALSGSDSVSLTKTQVNRVKKSSTAGKGTTLRLSYKQLSHSFKSGSGIFDVVKDLGKSLGNSGLNAGVNLLKNLGEKGINKGADLLQGKLEDKLGLKKGKGFLKRPISDLPSPGMRTMNGKGLFSDVLSSVGLGITSKPKRGRPKKMNGAGFLDNVLDVGKSLGNTALNTGLNVGQKVAEKGLDLAGQKLLEKMFKKGKGMKSKRQCKKSGAGLLDSLKSVGESVGNVGLKAVGGMGDALLNNAGNLATAAILAKMTSGRGLIPPGMA